MFAKAVVLASLLANAPPAPVDERDEGPGAMEEQALEAVLESGGTRSPHTSRRFSEEDLAPYFEGGPWAAAKRAFDRRQYATALRLLKPDTLPDRYLRAVSAARLGRQKGIDELIALAAEYEPMRDHCHFHAAQALERARAPRAAAVQYEAVRPESALYADARFALAEVLARNGALPEAGEALRPLRELPTLPRYDAVRRRALVRTIRLEQERRDFPAEYRASVELWATSPRSREAEAAWQRIKDQPVPNRWRLRRAEAFLAFNENDEAMRLASQVRTSLPDEEACRAGFLLGNALRKERRHRAAIRTLVPVVAACAEPQQRAQALYVLGYSQSVVDPPAAVRTYEALAGDYPSHPFADDALYLAAEVSALAKDHAGALRRLEEVASRYPASDFVAEALFKTAWLHRAEGRTEAALAALDRLMQTSSAGLEPRLRARYWRSRLLESTNPEEAKAGFEWLAKEHPVSWYGLLARVRLPEPVEPARCEGEGCTPTATLALEAGPLAGNPRFLAAVELIRLGLLKDAQRELSGIERRGLAEEPGRLLMHLLERAGNERGATAVARAVLSQHLKGAITAGTLTIWKALYPVPYRNLVERSAAKAKLDPDLVQALMREESRFNRWAKSSTGAIGLMQLMPGTAQAVARTLRLELVSEQALTSPSLNIRLGTAYLGSLVAELGTVPLAVAAYNAGPHMVRRWTDSAADLTAWVEQIPFTETRHYVMRVLASYAAYQLVYRSQTTPVTLREAFAR